MQKYYIARGQGCPFLVFDKFENDYFCKKDGLYLDSLCDCNKCAIKEQGETKEQIKAKLMTVLNMQVTNIDEQAEKILDYFGIK